MQLDLGLVWLVKWLAWRWKLMLAFGVLGLVVGGLILGMQGQEWQATATIAIVREKSQLVFDDRFTTSQDAWSDRVLQRETLRNLALTVAVERRVIDELGAVLPEQYREPGKLLPGIAVSYPPSSHLLVVSATADSRELAAAIADAWARQFISYANDLYGIDTATSSGVEKELAAAQASYEQVATALADYIGANRIDELESEIAKVNATLSAYNKLSVDLGIIADEATQLYQLLQSDDTDPTASRWSLVLIQTRLMGLAHVSDLPVQLQMAMDLPSDAEQDAATSLRKQRLAVGELLRVVTSWQSEIDKILADPASWENLGQLNQSRHEQQAVLDQLIAKRDVAREALQALTRKVQEIRIAAGMEGTEVRLASGAQGTEKPDTIGKLSKALFAAVVTCFAGTVLLLIRDGQAANKGRLGAQAEETP